jgi:hypothetical protein
VYRMCLPAARHPGWEVSSSVFCLVEEEAAMGPVDSKSVEQIHSCGGIITVHPSCGSRRIYIYKRAELAHESRAFTSVLFAREEDLMRPAWLSCNSIT